MGWCSAFGPQIRDGCDHAMVAAPDSCHCTECGAVCHGRFPGCTQVWATAADPDGSGSGRPPGVVADEPADLRGLRVDMQLLLWKVDRLRQEVRGLHDAGHDAGAGTADPMGDVAEALAALPEKLERAVARALRTQRRETRQLVAMSERKILEAIAGGLSSDERAIDGHGEAPTHRGPAPQVTARSRPRRTW
jgi:hypothetical protein